MNTTKNTTFAYMLASAMAMQGGAALAAGDLPKSGAVSREGTVERIVDRDTFIFRDRATNDTVDVHTTTANNVTVGERVKVNGIAQSEMLGIGHEIVRATVTPLSSNMGGPYVPADDMDDMTNDTMYDNTNVNNSGSRNDGRYNY